MKKTVFISYHFNDKSFKGEIVKWLKEANIENISVDEKDLRPEGDKVIEARIRKQIGQSDLLLILVGNDTHNRPWVDYEVKVAGSKQIPRKWVRLPNRTGAPPKEVKGLTSVEFKENVIKNIFT